MKNTNERYSIPTRVMHWAVAVIMIGMLALGVYMTGVELSPFKFQLYWWHKSIGAMVLVLFAARLIWRMINIWPHHPNHKGYERFLANVIQAFFYIAMIGMPMTGWMMSSAKGYPVSVFDWFILPDLIAPDQELGEILAELHTVCGYVLIGAILLHAAGAIKHHIIDRDDTLIRMLWGK